MLDAIVSFLGEFLVSPMVVSVFAIVLATVMINFVVSRIYKRLISVAKRTKNVWDDVLLTSSRGPVSWLIWVVGIGWAAEVVLVGAESDLYGAISPVRYVVIIVLLGIFINRFIVESGYHFAQSADETTVMAISKLLRISVMITMGLMILQTLGVSISGVLAFGGIGGVAVGFAAKDLLANFFGGLMLYLDRPFVVGDWVRSPDQEIEGTVEKIGWRLTLIRTFDQRPLYVPNATFMNISVENPSRMHNRRIYETIGIRYGDADKMKKIVLDVREMLVNHPDIDQKRTLIVNFNAFAASSLDFFIYTFTRTIDWIKFHEVKQNVLLSVLEIVEKNGAECAFPTSTIHMAPIPEPGDYQSAE